MLPTAAAASSQQGLTMDEVIVWIIIIGFYAPLHYLLPLMVLFLTGSEPETERRQLMRKALLDSTLSMVVAFAIVIFLVQRGDMLAAMLLLLAAMLYPFGRIWLHRHPLMGRE